MQFFIDLEQHRCGQFDGILKRILIHHFDPERITVSCCALVFNRPTISFLQLLQSNLPIPTMMNHPGTHVNILSRLPHGPAIERGGKILGRQPRLIKHVICQLQLCYIPLGQVLIKRRSLEKHASHIRYPGNIPPGNIAIKIKGTHKHVPHCGGISSIPFGNITIKLGVVKCGGKILNMTHIPLI